MSATQNNQDEYITLQLPVYNIRTTFLDTKEGKRRNSITHVTNFTTTIPKSSYRGTHGDFERRLSVSYEQPMNHFKNFNVRRASTIGFETPKDVDTLTKQLQNCTLEESPYAVRVVNANKKVEANQNAKAKIVIKENF